MIPKQAVVVPLYKPSLTVSERFSLERTIALLSQHDIFLVGPERLQPFLFTLQQQYPVRLKTQLFANHFFMGVAGYNKLLISEHFYAAFEEYEYLLIAQTDALVLKDELSAWCEKGYSYIGAPMFKGFTTPQQPLRFLCVGNGGFSLRRVADFLKVLRRPYFFRNKLMEDWPGQWWSTAYRYLKDYWCYSYKNTQVNVAVNEDLFWGLFVSARCDYFLVPELDEALKFSFETEPEYLYARNNNQLPFGCHAWERYGLSFWERVLPEHQIDISPIKSK